MQTVVAILAVLLAASASSGADAQSNKTKTPYTSFQTPTPYMPENDIRTGAVIVYNDSRAAIQSWIDKGYVVQTMYGFRTGDAYIADHRDEVQTTREGTLLTCGPGSYYMVPTPSRIEAAVKYFTNAISGGSLAVIPEEPEFFQQAGYSESFKKAWQEHYKEPWQDQSVSVAARYKSERLKAKMEYDMVKAIMDAAAKQKPEVRRMVACHSPVSYFAWGIIYPHYECLTIPNLQEIVGQVWTGTARSPCRYAGVDSERTFENAFLEYSSLYNLARGTGKRLWFLMDPLEDNLDRSMEDYNSNYIKTLVASLMFPEVDSYEVMPWPTRIYGRVPDEFATEIGSIVMALDDMHNHKAADAAPDWGTEGIATLVADSMGWQRGEPARSNYDCFYGLTLPLVYDGVPVQVAQLERTPDKDYLKPYKVLLLSYDILKPMKPEYNQAIADWVKQGGVLVFFGGTDAYNAVPEWWTKRGFASPQADLYSRLGVKDALQSVAGSGDVLFAEIARTDGPHRNLENAKTYRFDLLKFAKTGKPIYVRFRDAMADDGWGPNVTSVKLTAGGKTLASFAPGTDAEKNYLSDDAGSMFNGKARFADGSSHWTYKFKVAKGSSPTLEVAMGNQFLVEVSNQGSGGHVLVAKDGPKLLDKAADQIEIPAIFALTASASAQGATYALKGKPGCVIFDRPIGMGTLVHVGISPSYFASSPKAADSLRGIVEYACLSAGLKYAKKPWMAIKRGPYAAVRTFEGERKLDGAYIDLLDPKLPLVISPIVAPQQCAFYYDVTLMDAGTPTLMYSSSKVESKTETRDSTVLKLSGPLKTKGTARVFKSDRTVDSVTPDSVKVDQQAHTLLLTYDNKPETVDIQIKWR